MLENSNKILVALDGSAKAHKTIKYICSFKPFLNYELVLHNIITRVPECYYDLKKDPFSYKVTSQVRAWELGYRAQIQDFMEKARMKLIASGFKPEAISIKIVDRRKGIARDILEEAANGYYALLIRRRGGAKTMLPIAMGSVSTKLVGKSRNFPVMLAGVQKMMHSLFVAIDGSDGSKRAIEFIGQTIGGSNCKIVLCSVLRDFDTHGDKSTAPKSNGCIQSVFEEIELTMADARQTLEISGIKKHKIITKIIQGARSRSGAIVEAAKEENCDTIVFGRRGKSEVDDFYIGSIPWKVIHGARKMTIWLVP